MKHINEYKEFKQSLNEDLSQEAIDNIVDNEIQIATKENLPDFFKV